MSFPNILPAAPDKQILAEGAQYFDCIDRKGEKFKGEVYDKQGARSKYGFRRLRPLQLGWNNPFAKPDFCFSGGHAELTIRRHSFIPPVFMIRSENNVIGRIRMTSILRNRYEIEIHGVGIWTFWMPLFTVQFFGNSPTTTDIWVIVGPSKAEWNILFRPGTDKPQLVAALAFIHNEWWNYG